MKQTLLDSIREYVQASVNNSKTQSQVEAKISVIELVKDIKEEDVTHAEAILTKLNLTL